MSMLDSQKHPEAVGHLELATGESGIVCACGAK